VITIPTGDLTGIIADVIPFAFSEKDFPALCAVRLEWDGTRLHAFATDRIRLGWSQWEPGDVSDGEEVQDDLFTDWGTGDEPWATTLDLDDAKELVSVFKLPPKELRTPLTVDYDPERDRTKVVRARDTGHSAITVIAEGNGEVFPDLRVLLTKSDKLTKVTGQAYSAKFLADFAKVRPRGPMDLKFTAGLTRVSIGERFVGAIVPVQVN
jgi:hypothetical protein